MVSQRLGGIIMSTINLQARVERLDDLSRGLAREVLLWKEGNDPLLYAERKAYLTAIQQALAGIEDARVILARARQRLGPVAGESPLPSA
jgi:hypothetical protein